jgi:hypothetical protein
MLEPVKTLFGGEGGQLAIDEKRGGGVAMKGIQTQNLHVVFVPGLLNKCQRFLEANQPFEEGKSATTAAATLESISLGGSGRPDSRRARSIAGMRSAGS